MKLTALLLLVALACALPVAPAQGQEWADHLRADGVTEHAFGQVEVGQIAECTFVISNPLRQEVHIRDFSSSSGCMWEAFATRERLAPGESCEVTMRFNSRLRAGPVDGQFKIYFDEPFRGELRYRIRGEVVGDFHFQPTQLSFGQVPQGEAAELRVHLTRYADPRWHIAETRSDNAHLHAEHSPPSEHPRDTSYALTVRLDAEAPPGAFESQITITPTDPTRPTAVLVVSGEVLPTEETAAE